MSLEIPSAADECDTLVNMICTFSCPNVEDVPINLGY
jgi:hypothetical protein